MKPLNDNQNNDRIGSPVGDAHAPTLYCSLKNVSTDSNPTIELLTIPEVAELLKISVSGVRRLQQARHLPFVKVGGSVRFLQSDIASYLERQRVESIA